MSEARPIEAAALQRPFLQPSSWSTSSHRTRFEAIRPLVEGRRVLDLGAGSGQHRPDWMHKLIAEVAAEAVGIEYDPTFAEGARGLGFDVVPGDAQNIDLGRTFDVVFAGELIEHVASAGGLVETARRHLEPGGIFVLTTPNAFAISNFVYRVLPGSVRVHAEHTCWYCEDTIGHLLGRYGFVPEVSYLRHETPGRVRRVLAGAVRAPLRDKVAWNTLLVVARYSPAAS